MSHDSAVLKHPRSRPFDFRSGSSSAAVRCLFSVLVGCLSGTNASWSGEDAVPVSELTVAAEKALKLLETASAGSAEQRTCFTCHSQSHPVLAIVEAKRRGFKIDDVNLEKQVKHTVEHLNRGRQEYLDGDGQGGKSDTAGYALWTLQAGDFQNPETTSPVVAWLMTQQQDSGYWKRSSDRPPSEASHFATTYVALRGIDEFATEEHQSRVAEQVNRARDWSIDSEAADNEDRVFRLLTLRLVDAPDAIIAAATDVLRKSQREDGGWAQTATMDSDAYATGTAMFALQQTQELDIDDEAYRKGLQYLLKTQQPDGSWHVVSRSKPFQAYYETGFPHGKDQFISTSATAWATLAILLAHPETLPQQ